MLTSLIGHLVGSGDVCRGRLVLSQCRRVHSVNRTGDERPVAEAGGGGSGALEFGGGGVPFLADAPFFGFLVGPVTSSHACLPVARVDSGGGRTPLPPPDAC